MNMYIAEEGLQATKLGSYKLVFETISFLFFDVCPAADLFAYL